MTTEPAAGPPAGFPETADIETASDGYAARFAGRTGAWLLRVQERIVLDLLGDRPGAAVLDVGGGHGQLAIPLCRAGYRVTVLGSDASCRRRLEALVTSGRCEFRVGNVIALPFPDRAFDVAICFRLLPHCGQWPRLIAELGRVARHAVVADYPTSQSVNRIAPFLFEAKRKIEGNTRTWRPFRHAEILEEFAKAGFRPERRQGQFYLPMALHRALRCQPLSAALEGVCRGLGLSRRWGSPVIVKLVRDSAAGGGAHPGTGP